VAIFIIVLACNLTRTGIKEWVCTKKDDTSPSLDKAVELFRKLMQSRDKEVYIVATAKESPSEGNTVMCDRMKEYLVAKGIPSCNIFAHKAEMFNTYGEMDAAYEIINTHQEANKVEVEKVIICARWFHVWRACLIGYFVRRFHLVYAPQYPAPTRSNTKAFKIPGAILHEVLGVFKIPLYPFLKKG